VPASGFAKNVEGSVGVVGRNSVDGEGEGEERRSNNFAPRVPEGGEERASAVR